MVSHLYGRKERGSIRSYCLGHVQNTLLIRQSGCPEDGKECQIVFRLVNVA